MERIFYFAADTEHQILSDGPMCHAPTFGDVERFLKETEATMRQTDKRMARYWRRVKIFKVAIEEIPRTANEQPKSRKRTLEAKHKVSQASVD